MAAKEHGSGSMIQQAVSCLNKIGLGVDLSDARPEADDRFLARSETTVEADGFKYCSGVAAPFATNQ